MIFSPLEQFDIVGFSFFGNLMDNYSVYTNAEVYLNLSLLVVMFLFILSLNRRKVYSNNSWEIFLESMYFGIQDGVIKSSFSGSINRYSNFLPLLFTIFFYILGSNLLGLIAFGFTNTSFLIETFVLSSSALIAITFYGIGVQGLHWFEHFKPKGVPGPLVPFLIVIEVISYIAKGFSLAIRLFANMMSGHTLLFILSSFCIKLFKFSLIAGLIPFALILSISFLELGISMLQAYVFTVLLTIYFNESFISNTNDNEKAYDYNNIIKV